MKLILHTTLLNVLFYSACCENYFIRRENLFKDNNFRFGINLLLSEQEEKVDKFLTQLKADEHDSYLGSLQENGILDTLGTISSTKVFNIIKQLPKGALLHWHDLSMSSLDGIIKKWGYNDFLYTCFDEELKIYLFRFSKAKPTHRNCNWISVKEDRIILGNDIVYDQLLLSNFTLTKEKVDSSKSQDEIWNNFATSFLSIDGFVSYKPVFMDFIEQSLVALIQDNIQYAEIRALLQPLYDLDEEFVNPEETLKTFIHVIDEFKQDFKDLYHTKTIYCMLRSSTNEKLRQGVIHAISMYEDYPQHFAGLDLVGQEDTGRTQFDFIEELLLPKKLGKMLPYIFHAGETNFYGTHVDHNIHDSILLNTSRIGHGFALAKYPFLKQKVKENNIAIEICPISNQILGLVDDLRNHPGASLMAEDLAVTINSDDPGHWQTSPLSHDMYQAFMGMVPKHAGLRVLKQLFLNSIWHSSLSPKEKLELEKMWLSKWEKAIGEIITENNL